MGKLSKLFFEEVPQEPVETSYEYDDSYEEVDVNTENVSQDNLISDIYASNELADVSKSIFKVEELINSLPKEMPKETKKTTVLTILSSFGLTVDEVVQDGADRITIVRNAEEKITSDNKEVIDQNERQIEQWKVDIQNLEKDNADRAAVVKSSQDKIEEEEKRIRDLIEFIGGTEE